jgi:predicted small lipoprotein YifL
MQIRTFLVAIAAVVALASCGLVGGDGTLTLPPDSGDGAPSTEAPDTSAPDATVPDSDDVAETPWWLLLVVLGAFVILIIAFVSRGSKKKLVVAPAPTTWKDYAHKGYADARWLFDAMSEDLAIWRGNATYDKTSAVGATAGTALAETWAQLDTRIGTASDSLYAVEAAAPDQRTAKAASTVVASMRSVRRSVDDRAEARMNYRSVEASVNVGEVALQDAREREVRASRNLAEARSVYGAALTGLSTVL